MRNGGITLVVHRYAVTLEWLFIDPILVNDECKQHGIYIYIYHSHKSLEQYNYLHVRWINYSFYTLPFSMKAGNYIATFGEILILLYITIIHDIVSNSNLMIVCEPKNMNKLHNFSERTDKNFNGICLFLHFMQI